MASATRVGSRISVFSGEDVRLTTVRPDGWGAAMSDERLDRAALGLVAPAVGDGPDVLEPERRGDVAGHGVGVDEQDLLVAMDLERRREVGRDGRLADAALRVEDRDDGRPARPVAHLHRAALDDRAGAVVDGHRADAHRLDPPADRVGGVGAGEELVGRVRAEHPVDRARRHDHQRRDLPLALVEEPVVLERGVEVGLAVEDRDRDVVAVLEERLELVGRADGDRLEARAAELLGDDSALRHGQCDDDRRSRHELLLRWW